jgi:hypothetical protein
MQYVNNYLRSILEIPLIMTSTGIFVGILMGKKTLFKASKIKPLFQGIFDFL